MRFAVENERIDLGTSSFVDRRSFLKAIAAGVILSDLESSVSLADERIEGLPGKSQSPIEINHRDCKQVTNLDVKIEYDKPIIEAERSNHGLKFTTVKGNYISVGGEPYELKQLHLHTPAEHPYDGKLPAAEIHFVHQNAVGELAVMALLVNEGEFNKDFIPILDSIPRDSNERKSCSKRCNPISLLPEEKVFFTYNGSLTTPPFTEGVKWLVLEQPIELSGPLEDANSQLGKLVKVLGDNHRPAQPRNGRDVLLGS